MVTEALRAHALDEEPAAIAPSEPQVLQPADPQPEPEPGSAFVPEPPAVDAALEEIKQYIEETFEIPPVEPPLPDPGPAMAAETVEERVLPEVTEVAVAHPEIPTEDQIQTAETLVSVELATLQPDVVPTAQTPAELPPIDSVKQPVRVARPADRVGRILVSRKLVTEEQLTAALDTVDDASASIGSVLISCGFITEELLVKAVAAQMGVPAWDLEQDAPTAQALAKLSADLCRQHCVLPVQVRGDLLLVAMADPGDLNVIEAVRRASGMRVEPVLAFDQRLIRAIEEAHGVLKHGESLKSHVSKAMATVDANDSFAHEQHQLSTDEEERPIVTLVNQILKDAIRLRASDVHIEPRDGHVDIRYRVDGQLQKVREIPHSLLPMLTTRLKIMAELDIVEFRMPQDGRVAVNIDGRMVDLRVSVLPNHHGQRIVLRILDKSVALKKLIEIGFTEENLDLFRTLIQKPYGMLLVTGPTGSGKTTTLYAALEELREVTSNIMTCEDPIEYDIKGINQSQVNEKVGLTFAAQLRAILRQDPDIILVGEIRDGETAQTAIRAAMTGHLVLSTLHCNDAPSAIPRLLDMGADPFLLSTSLVGVMSQRLVRILCPHCKQTRGITSDEARLMESIHLGASVSVKNVCVPSGCPKCEGTGFRGRSAVHEIMPVTADVARAISQRDPMEIVRSHATHHGYRPMQEPALRLVLEGQTTLAEARRYVDFQWQAPAASSRRVA